MSQGGKGADFLSSSPMTVLPDTTTKIHEKERLWEMESASDPHHQLLLDHCYEEADATDDESYEDDDTEKDVMPLLHYNRLFGSLPRVTSKKSNSDAGNNNNHPQPLSLECTCTDLGKIVLNYSTTNQRPIENDDSNVLSSNTTNEQQRQVGQDVPIKQWQNQPISISVAGFRDGSIRCFDTVSGTAIVDSPETDHHADQAFHLTEFHNQRKPIVAVSLDATGTVFAAIDSDGHCGTWVVRYKLQYRQLIYTKLSSSQNTNSEKGNHTTASSFTKFFWKPKETEHLVATDSDVLGTDSEFKNSEENELVPTLSLAEVKIQRWQYSPKEYGTPTCLCLDPAFKYKQRVLVGFDSGKLVLTSRNWMLQTDHTLLPYTGPVTAKDWRGIEALQWRGTILAFCDCSGVKLYDMLTLRPIAHVDRPTGARPSLYPTTVPIVPSLLFETSRNLLVAWGDCLMDLQIQESNLTVGTTTTTTTLDGSAPSPTSSLSNVTRKRTVLCTMAWGLDCVAAGVVPLDANHVAVLGLLREDDEDEEREENDDVKYNIENDKVVEDTSNSKNHENNIGTNDVELQIIDRNNGFVVHADLLTLLISEKPVTEHFFKSSSHATRTLSHLSLLSSFAVPRMDDDMEQKELQGNDTGLVANIVGSANTHRSQFLDAHLTWNLKMVDFEGNNDAAVTEYDNDTDSVDSDNYGFIRHPMAPPVHQLATAPLMLVSSGYDMILARPRDIDDAIDYDLHRNKPATALRRAWPRVRQMKRFSIKMLVGEYLRSLLRLSDPTTLCIPSANDVLIKKPQHLSLRRMKLAAEALPRLLGGDVDMWVAWLLELEKIPGALFVVRNHLPVRDPRLPPNAYIRVLGKMLEEVDGMKVANDPETMDRLAKEAERHFLNTLIAWGTTNILKEHIELYEYQSSIDGKFEGILQLAVESLYRRNEQTSVGYLEISSPILSDVKEVRAQVVKKLHNVALTDSLYKIDELIMILAHRIKIIDVVLKDNISSVVTSEEPIAPKQQDSRVALEALSKLYMMKGRHDEALKCYLVLGALHAPLSFEAIEERGLSIVNRDTIVMAGDRPDTTSLYAFVLLFIEKHHLHQYLLESSFLPDTLSITPICALIRLVGIELLGRFLLEHCIAPQQLDGTSVSKMSSVTRKLNVDTSPDERRGTLPLNLVADQLAGSPQLFHWYLHLVFVHKPEIYVRFPHTTNPSTEIVNLHKKHLDLYIKFAGPNRDSAKALEGIEAYRVMEKSTTPLLSFMKAILPLGTIAPVEVVKRLEIERRGGSGGVMALELAYFMENYGIESESGARLILDLYLTGAKSLMLAVSYAQRNNTYSSLLWEILINHCLPGRDSTVVASPDDGQLFGSLLEASALVGADLAKLVAQIPPGMQVEGLRPRLVSAIADYRFKVQLHRTSSEIATKETRLLFHEAAVRARRGMIFDAQPYLAQQMENTDATNRDNFESSKPQTLSPTLRTKTRPNRYKHTLSIAIR